MTGRLIDDAFLDRLQTFAMATKTSMRGYFGGTHRTAGYGSTVEFAEYREYVPGDDIRRVDWNLYGRFERFFIKLFADERQMHNRILIDTSASMAKADPAKAEYALRLAAAMGYLSVLGMDKVSFGMLDGNACQDLAGTVVGKEAFFGALERMEEVPFGGECDLGRAIKSSSTGHSDGVTVILSDFLTDSDWRGAVDYLLFHKRQVLLVQVLSPGELSPEGAGRTYLCDSESIGLPDPKNMKHRINKGALEAYERALKEYLEDVRRFCASRGCDYTVASTDTPIERLLFGSLYELGVVK